MFFECSEIDSFNQGVFRLPKLWKFFRYFMIFLLMLVLFDVVLTICDNVDGCADVHSGVKE